ncbi:hypothetical protein C0Q44_15000 [Paenibacillus sp. PCH8]|uniref:hypothetical protein n=1 Tax=Paenibacillus sp. PCH8 TaxID=2066524 RepID=UPI000CF9D39C|nr:hypothetical protein [Paenibacillus sp. PCH8]PQP82709.1 hypothetical protein C0Q44_15000 [Paenibacillus sp. PCH8]
MKEWDYSKPWFHGSPMLLNELLVGSTITQDRELARIFSHKPSIVAFDENGTRLHNGKLCGYIYIIDEEITSEDVYPHPATTMNPGEEWLIKRGLKVRKIDETKTRAEEQLSEEEEVELLGNLKNR